MLTRRKFLTGLGLGGVVVATPPVARGFLDVGKATREGEARFKLKTPRKFERAWSASEEAQLKLDEAAHKLKILRREDFDLPLDEEDYEGEWWRLEGDVREGLRLSYRDTHIDRENGDIWIVNPETNIATKAAAGTTRGHLTSSLLKAPA